MSEPVAILKGAGDRASVFELWLFVYGSSRCLGAESQALGVGPLMAPAKQPRAAVHQTTGLLEPSVTLRSNWM